MLRSLQRALVLVPLLGGCKPSSLDPIVTGSSSGPGTSGGDTSVGAPTTGTDTGSTTTQGPDPGTSTGAPGATSTGFPGETSTGVGGTSTGVGGTSTGEATTLSSSSTVAVDTTLDLDTSTGPVPDTSSESSSTGTPDGTTTGEPVMPSECLDSTPLVQWPDVRVLDGLEACQNGQVHRPAGIACVHPLVVELCEDPMKCKQACDVLGDGVCNKSFENSCACRYPCETDADCADNAACLCRATDLNQGHIVPISQCYPAQCRTDADCGGFQCGVSPGVCGPGGVRGLFCRGPADECQTHQECLDKQLGNMCWFDNTRDHWACTESAICE